MPIERRRRLHPDPIEFKSPRAEEIYWATERLLDEAPQSGKLQLRYLYDSWHKLRNEFLGKDQSDDESRQIAWATLAFFCVERVGDIVEQLSKDEEKFRESAPGEELNKIQIWIEMQERHYDEETESYRGEPFFGIKPETVKETPLHEHSPMQAVDPGNPDSPTFGHLQLLDKAADRQPISDALENAVLTIAARRKDFLRHIIDNWNEALTRELPARADEEDRTYLLESTYRVLALTMVESYGNEKFPSQRLELLDIYLSQLGKQPNTFKDFLNLDGFQRKLEEELRRRLGAPATDKEMEYHVPESALKEIKSLTSLELKYKGEPSAFTVDLKGYKGLDFGLIITWDPESQLWIGNAIISYEGGEPPRSICFPIRLLNVQGPQEAAAGLISYYREHPKAFRPPKKSSLTKEEKEEVLQQLRLVDMKRLRIGEDPEAQERALRRMSSLLREIGDFKKFPPRFCITVCDPETQDIYFGIPLIQKDSINLDSKPAVIEDNEAFIALVDEFIQTRLKYEKVIVCSDSLYQLIIKDPKSKVRASLGRKTVIKRPAGLITVYRGATLH